MGFVVNHGDISGALGLAAKAGTRIKAQDDLDFIRMMQQAQAQYDQQNANEISQSLGVQEFNANMDMKNAAMQQAQAQQNVENQQANRRLDITQQSMTNANENADARNAAWVAQQGAANQYRGQQIGINQQNADTAMNRPGSDRSFQQLEAEARRLNALVQQKAKQMNAFVYDDRRDLGYKDQGQRLPEGGYVIKGMETQYARAKQEAQQLQAQLDGLNSQLTTRTNSLTGQSTPTVDPTTVNKMVEAPQPAPANNSGGPQTVHDATEYAQIRSGETYIWAGDGKLYTKK